MNENKEMMTTNSKGELVPGSKAKYLGVEFDVGQIIGKTAMLYRNGRYEKTADIDDLERL
jgi:hypothetical protein